MWEKGCFGTKMSFSLFIFAIVFVFTVQISCYAPRGEGLFRNKNVVKMPGICSLLTAPNVSFDFMKSHITDSVCKRYKD